nr:MAG TPA: hypothetical protein [Caudoviricetes sp.]
MPPVPGNGFWRHLFLVSIISCEKTYFLRLI